MPNKTAFVTGGTGFIGRQPRRAPHPVGLGCGRAASTQLPADAVAKISRPPRRRGDRGRKPRSSALMPEDVDAVFHVAGDVSLWSGHRERQWRTNVEGTRNMVATALAKRAKKFVHTSDQLRLRHANGTLRRDRAEARKGQLQLSEVKGRGRGRGRKRNCSGVGRGLSEPRQCHRPLRLEHVVKVHTPGGEPATVPHSAGTRLLRRCRGGGAGACCGRREGADRGELYSRRARGLLCRDRADRGRVARHTDQYNGRPSRWCCALPAASRNGYRRSPERSR